MPLHSVSVESDRRNLRDFEMALRVPIIVRLRNDHW